MADGRKSNRGFASMSPERQREIASMGGKAIPPEKRSFSRNPKLAAEAGRKGGQSIPAEKRTYFRDRALAAECGKKGGQAVNPENRSFSQNRQLASEAGRKGGATRGRASTEQSPSHAEQPPQVSPSEPQSGTS